MESEVESEEKPEEEKKEEEYHICPYCETPQEFFIYRSEKRGWAMCPDCERYIRRRDIPERFIKVVEREPPKEEEEEEWEEGRLPFRRPRSPWLILKNVLEEIGGIKPKAQKLIIARCKRMGELNPNDLQRILMDLDTGLKKTEAAYIAEEYYYALQAERQRHPEYERVFPYAPRREEEYYRAYPTSPYYEPTYPYSPYRLRRPWERPPYPPPQPLTEQRLMEILSRRDREWEERMRQTRVEDNLTNLMKQVIKLGEEIKALKEHPPVSTPPNVVTKEELEKMRADSYIETLKLQLESLKEDRKELLSTLKEDRERFREEFRILREWYDKKIEKMEEELKEAERRAGRTTEGYRSDEIRFAAEGLHRFADVIEKKEPVRIIVERAPELLGLEKPPPRRERGKPSSVADLVGEEYVEE